MSMFKDITIKQGFMVLKLKVAETFDRKIYAKDYYE